MAASTRERLGSTDRLLRTYRETGDTSARAEVIERHLPLVRVLARRYAHRGERMEDLVQVGSIGLIDAVDRFDPTRGDFVSFAVPTISGQIKNHFRDRSKVVRIPRGVAALSERPRVVPLSELNPDGEPTTPAEDTFETCDDRLLLAAGFRTLDARQRRILHLRFYAGLSQSEIAGEVGLSQIQVSRVIRASLERMRRVLARTAAREPVENL
jgi:RNA polymerase sigma-B factor